MSTINANRKVTPRMALMVMLVIVPTYSAAYQSFDEFVAKHRRSYSSKEEEHKRREIYESNLEKIIVHNSVKAKVEGHHYELGLNHFMDLEQHELPFGYDKSSHNRRHVDESSNSEKGRTLTLEHTDVSELPFSLEAVENLPTSVDWRHAATPVKDQGYCGSCWAFASIAALESHLFLQSGLLYSLSIQELVSCAPNPKECGGAGGCTGATSVQAYGYIQDAGVVQEWSFGYGSYRGSNLNCTLETKSNHSSILEDSVALIDGFITLPPNNYTIMMNAVAKFGPVVISVAADQWHLYRRGVFRHNFTKAQDADINHAVVLMGYGTDEETGEDYWLVRNSWSPRWGEKGYIRLYRSPPGDNDCAMDVTPGDGDACKFDSHGNPIPVSPQKVCGTSGAYYLGYVPTGVRPI